MKTYGVIFTRSDTLQFLPGEEIEVEEGAEMTVVIRAVEKRRLALSEKLSKEMGCRALFALLINENGSVVGYNANNF